MPISPQIRPGPLSRADADAINQALRDLYSLRFTGAPPVDVRQGVGGVSIAIQTAALAQVIVDNYAPLSVLDHAGTVVDPHVATIKADPLLKLTWSELSAGNVQTIIDSGAIIWNGGTPVLLPGAPTWDLVGFVFNFISSTGGYFNFGAPLEICSSLYWCCTTATLASASVNNYVLPSNKPVFNLTAVSGGSALTGIVSTQVLGATGPQVIVINNVGADPIIINNNSASSLAANRILLPPTYGSAVTLAQNDSCILWYDTCTSSKWRMIECTVDPDAGVTDVDTACDTYAFLSGSEHDVVLPTATASIQEYNVTAFAGGTTVDGFVPQTLTTGPQIITLINVGTDGVTISTATGSVAANRIVLPPTYSGSVILAQDDTITLWYDSCAASPRWYVLACTVDPDAGGTASTAIATLGSSFTVPTTAMSNIGLSISLPSAGNYVLMANIHALATPPAGPPVSANIQAQLHDGTSIVTDSQTEVMNIETGTGNFEATAPITVPYTATGAVTINVQAVGQTTTATPMKIAANATTFGHTRIMYLKLS